MERYNSRFLHSLSMSHPGEHPNIRNGSQYLQPNSNKGTYNTPLLKSVSRLETPKRVMESDLLDTKSPEINILVKVLQLLSRSITSSTPQTLGADSLKVASIVCPHSSNSPHHQSESNGYNRQCKSCSVPSIGGSYTPTIAY